MSHQYRAQSRLILTVNIFQISNFSFLGHKSIVDTEFCCVRSHLSVRRAMLMTDSLAGHAVGAPLAVIGVMNFVCHDHRLGRRGWSSGNPWVPGNVIFIDISSLPPGPVAQCLLQLGLTRDPWHTVSYWIKRSYGSCGKAILTRYSGPPKRGLGLALGSCLIHILTV